MRWLNKIRIRRRIKKAPYFDDFWAVRGRKSASFAIAMQERCAGDRHMYRHFRAFHFRGISPYSTSD